MVEYAPATTVLRVPNTFPATQTRVEGVKPGMSYDLVVSLERHEINPDAVTLKDKFITVVEGAGKGQTARIVDYNPETRTYTLVDRESGRHRRDEPLRDRPEHETTSTTTSRRRDSYDVVLTSRPNEDVVIDVAPRRTRTYNSDRAFDPAANFGEADEIQVRVATNRAHFELERRPRPHGERWIVTLGALDPRPDARLHARVRGAGDWHAADDDRDGARRPRSPHPAPASAPSSTPTAWASP